MTSNKNEYNPMGLDDLPEYLKSLKEKGSTGGDSCFVEMGTIKPTVNKWKWIQRIVLASAICTILGTTGVVTHDFLSTNQLTVVVDLNKDVNPAHAIPQMITDSGGTVLAVKQQEGSSAYEVKVSTRKSRKLFLEWLQKNKNVKEAK